MWLKNSGDITEGNLQTKNHATRSKTIENFFRKSRNVSCKEQISPAIQKMTISSTQVTNRSHVKTNNCLLAVDLIVFIEERKKNDHSLINDWSTNMFLSHKQLPGAGIAIGYIQNKLINYITRNKTINTHFEPTWLRKIWRKFCDFISDHLSSCFKPILTIGCM